MDQTYDIPGGSVCFLRAATLPVAISSLTHVDLDVTDPRSDDQLRARLIEWWWIPEVPEAILLASASVYRSMDRLSRGGELSHKELVRLFRSMATYLLRLSNRPTPFGTMAGVAIGRVAHPGEPGEGRFGATHERWIRPDWGWLTALLTGWEPEPDVLDCLMVVRNNLAFRRGGRWVNPHPQELHPVAGSQPTELSVRLTPALEFVLASTAVPVRADDLIKTLAAELPSATTEGARAFVGALVRQEFLVSDLIPPFHEQAVLDHVLDVLDRRPAATVKRGQIAELAATLAQVPSAAAGERVRMLHGIERRMAELTVADHAYLQTDLGLDADVVIPQEVTQEAARAAEAAYRACRMPRMANHLRAYHEAFVEVYGTGTVVPLMTALDAERGIGAPATYERPLSARRTATEPRPQAIIDADQARTRHLGARLQQLWRSGAEELRLSDEDLRAIRPDVPPGRLPFEFGFHLLSRSTAAIEQGDFELIWAPYLGGTQLLTGFGRFFHLLDREAVTDTLGRAGHLGGPDTTTAHVAFHVPSARATNIARHAAVVDKTIHVGSFHDPGGPGVVDLADLGVYADHEMLHLVSMTTGTEIVPRLYTMLNPRATNNVVRFLREFAADQARSAGVWRWDEYEDLPYLPRVTYGRTTLARAQWRPPEGLSKYTGPAERDRIVAEWQDRMTVPATVQLAVGDQRVALDLAVGSHRDLFAWHCRRPGTVVYENRENLPENVAWCNGRAHEIYLPLRPTTPVPRTARRTVPKPYVPTVHPPGGHWYYAKIYLSADRHDTVLRGPVQALVDSLPEAVDRWFFIRYADPEPHLRLRVHCADLAAAPAVRDLVEQQLRALCLRGEAARFVVDTYAPEYARYGGPDLMADAERLFCADSRAVLRLLSTPEHDLGGLTRSEAGILNAVMVAELIAPGEAASWLVAQLPQEAETASRRLVRSRIESVLQAPPPGLARTLGNLREAALGYVDRVRALDEPQTAANIGLTLTHMHFNRLLSLSTSRDGESEGLVLARQLAKHALGSGRELRICDAQG